MISTLLSCPTYTGGYLQVTSSTYIHTLVIPVLLLIASLIAVVVVDDDDAIADRSFILRAALVV